MRFIATADWQLGMTAHFLPAEGRVLFAQARLDVVRRIADVAQEHHAEFVVVAGDVFDSNQLDRAIISRTFDALAAFSVPVILLPGNHDALSAASIYDDKNFVNRCPPHVHVVRDSAPFTVVDGIEIIGAPWFSKDPRQDLVAEALVGLAPPDSGIFRVLVGHGAVSTLNPDRESLATIDVAALSDALAHGVVQCVVLGDKHSTTEVADGIWYPGAPEVTHRREPDPGNVLVIDVDTGDNSSVSVEKLPVGQWAFSTISAELNGADDVASFLDRLQEIPDKSTTAVWLALSGTLTMGEYALLQDGLIDAADLFARMDHWERHTDLAILPDDHDFTDLGLSGFARDALSELTELAAGSNGESATTAQDALALLYRLSGGASG